MHVLFVHQNFPAQFRCVAPRLASDYGWNCTFVTANDTAPDLSGVRRIVYPRPISPDATPLTRRFHDNVGHAHAVYSALKARPEVRPDLVVAHSGFGSSLFLPQLYDAPVVNFFEFFYRPVGQDLGYRPELALTERGTKRGRGERRSLRPQVRAATVLTGFAQDVASCQNGGA